MGKRSVRENKNVFQLAREDADLTRAEASEALEFISQAAISATLVLFKHLAAKG